MKSLYRYKHIFPLVIFTIAAIYVAYKLGAGLFYTILVGLVSTILGGFVANWVSKALKTEPMPWIKTYPDHEKSVQEIDRFLHWLIKSEKVCDLATLYVGDELDINEFNLIAHQGLYDRSPMYGPMVFDDRRHELSKEEVEGRYEPIISTEGENPKGSGAIEVLYESIISTKGENPKGFRARESILSRASFIMSDDDRRPIAALYLNWRNKQEFTDFKQKELLANYTIRIFTAVGKIGKISRRRQMSNNAELKARRWIDSAVTHKTYEKFDHLIFESIICFFEGFDGTELKFDRSSELKFRIARKDGDKFEEIKRDYITRHSTHLHGRLDSNDDARYMWVSETTRPLFLSRSLDNQSNAHKIIVPIRSPPDLSKCSGVILIECVYAPLIPEMVKPLCNLADHFGLIEDQITSG